MKSIIYVGVLVLIGLSLLIIISFSGQRSSLSVSSSLFPTTCCVVFKSHVWNRGVRDQLRRIREDILRVVGKEEGVPRPVLVFLWQGKASTVNREAMLLVDHVEVVTDDELREVYPSGFVDPWLSNHWSLMAFFRRHRSWFPEFVWTIEHDVRICGDSNVIWQYNGSEDFVASRGPFQSESWPYRDRYVGPMRDDEKWYGYLQLARYSRRFLEYVDGIFQGGENGQDEMMMFSLVKRREENSGADDSFRVNSEFLSSMQARDDRDGMVLWTADNGLGKRVRDAWQKMQRACRSTTPTHTTKLFHPVKGDD